MTKDTRQNIIDAAIFTFNEDLSAPLEKVADNAGVTRRTLHRYFKDRKDLLICCNQEMYKSCSRAMMLAHERSKDPLEELKNFLYAAIDCGVKYAFLHKLHHLHGHQHLQGDKECVRYDQTFDRVKQVIEILHHTNIISNQLSAAWVSVLFHAVVTAAINALNADSVETERIKTSSWLSFSRGISA
jgi:AcrR family transcriptional regulator